MAKHKKPKRRFRKYLKGKIAETLLLSTLGSEALTSALVGDVVTEKAWLTSVLARWAMSGFTAAAGDGPVLVGVAHSDYTDAEIEDWIEQSASWDQSNKIGQEVGKRFIREVGVFDIPVGAVPGSTIVLNDGKPIRTKCGWQLASGQTIRWWAYNMATAGPLTDGSIVQVQGHANLWPN